MSTLQAYYFILTSYAYKRYSSDYVRGPSLLRRFPRFYIAEAYNNDFLTFIEVSMISIVLVSTSMALGTFGNADSMTARLFKFLITLGWFSF